jgi:hypothetical protein
MPAAHGPVPAGRRPLVAASGPPPPPLRRYERGAPTHHCHTFSSPFSSHLCTLRAPHRPTLASHSMPVTEACQNHKGALPPTRPLDELHPRHHCFPFGAPPHLSLRLPVPQIHPEVTAARQSSTITRAPSFFRRRTTSPLTSRLGDILPSPPHQVCSRVSPGSLAANPTPSAPLSRRQQPRHRGRPPRGDHVHCVRATPG